MRERELDYEKRKNEFTLKDVEFDENFMSKNPGLKGKIFEVLEQRKNVFRNIIGKVHDKFAIDGTIKGDFTLQRQTQVKRSVEEEKAIIAKLDQEVADGILGFPENEGIVIKNFIPIMSVPKKDDEGNILPFCQGLRLVNDCKKRLNKVTDFCAMEIDSLSETLRKAAIASKHKYKAKFDISNAFYQIPINKKLWEYFGVHHPKMGQLCYKRLSQSWVSSFGWAANVFLKIFHLFSNFLFRYMDDVFISGETEDEFLSRLNQVLKVCEYYGIT